MRKEKRFLRVSNSLIAGAFLSALGVANLAAPLVHATGAFTGSGSGTSGSPYVVASCTEFEEISSGLSASYLLSQNIDCSGAGNSVEVALSGAFTGTFDGGNHTLTVAINDSAHSNVGVFGTVIGGTIKNLTVAGSVAASNSSLGNYVGVVAGQLGTGSTVTNVTVAATLTIPNGSDYEGVGAIAGALQQSTASHVSSSGTITSKVDNVGGLFGNASGSSITDSHSSAGLVAGNSTFVGGITGFDGSGTYTSDYSTGDVTGFGAVGGIIGATNGGHVTQSYTTGAITGSASTFDTGGIIGEADSGALISNSYSTGDVTGGQAVGGLAGVLGASGSGTINQSYATGAISGTTHVGPLAGWVVSGTVTNSFWNTETSGQLTGAGTGETTAAMKDLATYTSLSTSGLTSAWDFMGTSNDDTATNDVWALYAGVNDGYPCLTWDSACAAPTDPTIPNSGDANGDGTQDSTQANIAGSVNPVTHQYALVQAGSGCTVGSQSVAAAPAQDAGYSYPAGLMNFTVHSCGASGFTTTVTQYYYGVVGSNFVLRKYNPTTKKYTAVTGATISKVTIGGQTAAKVSYQVTDGGPLDEDGTANGTIVDPVGLAVADLTDTGYNAILAATLSGALIVLAVGARYSFRRK